MATKPSHRTLWLWIAVLVACAAYFSPWVVSSNTGLTFGAYDLAEWASLHPEVRATPLLMTSLLLRLQVALLAGMIALYAPHPLDTRGTWLCILTVTLIATALLPPLEFFSEMRGDGNYQQQFGMAIITLGVGAISIGNIVNRWRRAIGIALATAGVMTSTIGLVQAMRLLEQFRVHPQLGMGGILWIGVYLTVGYVSINSEPKSKQGSA